MRLWRRFPFLPYLAFGRAAFQRQLVYRSANWAGLSTNLFFLLFRAYAFKACFQHTSRIGELSASEVTTYVTVTQALIMVAPQWGNLGLADSVRSGQVAVELLRPANLFGMYLSQRLAISLYYVFARMLPVLAFGWCLDMLHLPWSWSALLPLVFSVICGAWIGACILFLIEASSFWLESDQGVRALAVALNSLFSGLTIPIDLLWPWLKDICQLTPFTHTLNTPSQLWLGRFQGEDLIQIIGIQFFWVITLSVVCLWILHQGARKVQVMGG